VPPTVTETVLFCAATTRLPAPLSHAVTWAFFGPAVLMALIRSPTVLSVVGLKFVVLVPSLTVIVLFGAIPRVNSDVPPVSGIVPVPVAGEPVVEAGVLEPFDDVELLVWDWTALCAAASSSELTRSKAVWLAMLARPLTSLVMSEPIAVISALLAVEA